MFLGVDGAVVVAANGCEDVSVAGCDDGPTVFVDGDDGLAVGGSHKLLATYRFVPDRERV